MDTSPCHKEGCSHPAQLFFFTPTTQRKLVCKRHRPKLSEKTFSIAQAGFIESPQDESLFDARVEEVKAGRKALETLKKKAAEEVKAAIALLESEKSHTIDVVVRTYNSMIRRARQHHQQIAISLQLMSDELELYTASKDTTLASPLTYGLKPMLTVPALMCVHFVTPDLELMTLLNDCFSMSELPLREHLTKCVCPVDRQLYAYQRFLQGKYAVDSQDFVELKKGGMQAKEAVEVGNVEGAEIVREKLTKKIAELTVIREATIVSIETEDAPSVKQLISDYTTAVSKQTGDTRKLIEVYEQLSDVLIPHSQSFTAAHIYRTLGDLYTTEEAFEKAKQAYEAALPIFTSHFSTHIETVICYTRLGKALTSLRQFAKAKESFISAHRIATELHPFHIETAEVYRSFAKVYSLLQRYEKAAEYYEEALRILANGYPLRVETLDVMVCLGNVYFAANRWTDAEQRYLSAAALGTSHYPNSPQTVSTFLSFARLLDDKNRNSEAEKCYKTAIRILRSSTTDKAQLLPPLYSLALVNVRTGRHNDGEIIVTTIKTIEQQSDAQPSSLCLSILRDMYPSPSD